MEIKFMDSITIKLVETEKEITDAREVRRQVFQLEQGISSELDFDGKDRESDHVVVYLDKKPVGTVRLRYLDEGKKNVKVERMAVLSNVRGQHIGQKMMEYSLEYLKSKGIKDVILRAQAHAKGFYERFGFVQKGEAFEEAGIEHVEMVKQI